MGKSLIIPGADFSTNSITHEVVPVQYTLVQGYASVYTSPSAGISLDSGASASIRVRTGQLYGKYTVKTKTGYVIRGIVQYDTYLTDTSPGNHSIASAVAVQNVQGLTEYTFNQTNKYSIITFCNTDATATISPSEDIVDYIIRP